MRRVVAVSGSRQRSRQRYEAASATSLKLLHLDSWVAVMDPESGKLIKRLEVGQSGANISFCPDGRFGYVAVTGENTVAVVEMESLEVEKKLQTGEEPISLIVL